MEHGWYEKGSGSSVWGSGSGSGGVQSVRRWFMEMIWSPLLAVNKKVGSGPSVRLLFIAVCLFVGAFVSTRLLDATVSPVAKNSGSMTLITTTEHIEPSSPLVAPNTTTEHIEPSLPLVSPNTTTEHIEPSLLLVAPNTTTVHTEPLPKKPRKKIEIPLNCSSINLPRTCPNNYYPKTFDTHDQEHILPPIHMCPEYFRWIYEDLKPWMETGITEEMVERAKRTANFRLVIMNGTAYVETYVKSFQSRDVFTLWGILQLLRRYPGKVPDLDLMFDCVDWPVVLKKFYRGRDAVPPPPLFRYCGDDSTLDIVFPDWSFWGWAEINIRPWDILSKDLEEGNRRTKWIDREPYAYWKGNPFVAETRKDLLKCNVSDQQDWNARIYIQDWGRESQEGFKQSNLASQCVHRYKIYIEGSAWSVSEKYILACDSVTLLVKPRYYDFFTRGLMPVHHYWPINEDDKCRSIKFAVDWGNSHKQKAQEIGRAGGNFIYEHLKMERVYDYMFHLLNEYSKLMKYKPRIPQKAVELCSESMGCSSEGYVKQFMMESMVKGPADVGPCTMHPPFDPQTLKTLVKRKTNSIKTVEKWEREYYEKQTNQG